MKNKEVVLITLLVIAIVLSTISIAVNISSVNEMKEYISPTPTGNIVFSIDSIEEVPIEGGIVNEQG